MPQIVFDSLAGQERYRRPFRMGWMAQAVRDPKRGVWILSAIDHSNLTFCGEASGDIDPEYALDRAELLAP